MFKPINKKEKMRSGFFRVYFLYRKQIFILFLLNLFSSSFLLISPAIGRLFIDQAFINKNFKIFLNLSVWGAFIFIFSVLVKAGADTLKNKIAVKLKLSLTSRFLRKFYSLDLEFFQSRSIGENAYRLFDIEQIVRFISEDIPSMSVEVVKLPVILAVCFWINPDMTVFLFVLSPLFILHRLYLQKKLRKVYKQIWSSSVKLTKNIYEAFSRILVIKTLGLESFQRHSYLKALIKNTRLSIQKFRWLTFSGLASSILSKFIYGLISLYGGWLIIKGRISLGSYTAVMLYLTQVGAILEVLGYSLEYATEEMVSLEKFFEIISSQPQIKDLPGARNLAKVRGEIQFENTCFGYTKEKPVLNDLNFVISASSWIAIAGASGSGKTTLANLILRLYEPWTGRILLDGVDLKTINLRSLRGKIAVITQQPFLFDVSLKENIAYGLKSVSAAQINEAARLACIDDFISHLPEGYDTIIGEDAYRLSQGLKQRVAIARAVLRRPQILILDEAASSVDSLTEEKIFTRLRQNRRGLTTVIISHRLFSIKDADRIFFLKENGQIEEGGHCQLLKDSLLYRDFFYNQSQGNGCLSDEIFLNP